MKFETDQGNHLSKALNMKSSLMAITAERRVQKYTLGLEVLE